MGNVNIYQVIIGVLFIFGAVFIYFFVSSKNKAKSDLSDLKNNTVTQSQKDSDALSDDALIAVLTAAVMSMQSDPNIKIKVTSFRRIPQSAPIWNVIGRRERMENKL